MFISPLSLSLSLRPPPFFSVSVHRAAQQSRWTVHISPAAPASPSTPCLHMRPSSNLHSSQPAEEDHAHAVPGQSGQPGGRHKLEHRPGPASQQLGAQQQHSPGDQVREAAVLRLFSQQCPFLTVQKESQKKKKKN